MIRSPKKVTSKRRYFFILAALAIVLASPSLHAQIKNLYDGREDNLSGITSLMSAVASNDVGGVKFFAKAGASVVNQKNLGGATALTIACRENNLEIVKILVENGADVNVADNEGWTPLMRAATAGNQELVEFLLSRGAQAASLNLAEESVIFHAASSDCNDCLAILFNKFNFPQYMNIESLKSQLTDSFVVARNHENQVGQDLISAYLERISKIGAANEVATDASSLEVTVSENKTPQTIGKKKYVFKSKGETVSVAAEPVIEKPTPVKKTKGKFVQQEMSYPKDTKFKFVVGAEGKSNTRKKVKIVAETKVANEAKPSEVEEEPMSIIKDPNSQIDALFSAEEEEEIIAEIEPADPVDGVVYKFNVGPGPAAKKMNRRVVTKTAESSKSEDTKAKVADSVAMEVIDPAAAATVAPTQVRTAPAYKFNVGPAAKKMKRKVAIKAAEAPKVEEKKEVAPTLTTSPDTAVPAQVPAAPAAAVTPLNN